MIELTELKTGKPFLCNKDAVKAVTKTEDLATVVVFEKDLLIAVKETLDEVKEKFKN